MDEQPPDQIKDSQRNSSTSRCDRNNLGNLYWSSFRTWGFPASLAVHGDTGYNRLPINKTMDLVSF